MGPYMGPPAATSTGWEREPEPAQGAARFARRSTARYGKGMVTLLLWLILLVLCWPLAVLVLLLWPLVWLISLPLRIVGITLEGVFELLRSLLLLPARVLRGPR